MTTDQEKIVKMLLTRANAAAPGDVRISGPLHGVEVRRDFSLAAKIVEQLDLIEEGNR